MSQLPKFTWAAGKDTTGAGEAERVIGAKGDLDDVFVELFHNHWGILVFGGTVAQLTESTEAPPVDIAFLGQDHRVFAACF